MGLNFLWGILILLQGCFLPLQRRWCQEVFRGRIDGWDELEGKLEMIMLIYQKT